jgi:hypothetical protein
MIKKAAWSSLRCKTLSTGSRHGRAFLEFANKGWIYNPGPRYDHLCAFEYTQSRD